MIELAALGTTFVSILLAEVGDKTQIMTLALAARSRSVLPVFAGAVLGEVAANTIAVAIGTFLGLAIPVDIVRSGAGVVFVLFGITSIIKKEKTGEVRELAQVKARSMLWSAFYLIALAEMGDKTQVVTIGLSARYQDPVMVLVGLSLAFMVLSLFGAIVGERASRILPMYWIRIGSGLLFIVFGILFAVNLI